MKKLFKNKSANSTPIDDTIIYGKHSAIAYIKYAKERIIKAIVSNNSTSLIKLLQENNIGYSVVSSTEIGKLYGEDINHQGIVLICKPFVYTPLKELLKQKANLCVILDCIEDARNLGAIARACVAFGAQFIVIPKNKSAKVNAFAEKTASGALAMIKVALVANINNAIKQLQSADYWIIGSSTDKQARPCWQFDLNKPCALVIGNEKDGMRQLTNKFCDEIAYIPMKNLNLNAADAAAVLLYEISRQKIIANN